MTDKSFKRYKRFLFAVIFLSAYTLCITPWFIYLEDKQSDSFFNYAAYIAKVDLGTSKKDKKADLESPKKHKISKLTLKSKAKKLIKPLRFLIKKVRKRHPFFIKFCKNLGRSWYATSRGWHSSEILLIQIPIILSAIWGLLVNLAEGSGSFFDISTPHPEDPERSEGDEGSYEILQPFGLQDEPSGESKQKKSLRVHLADKTYRRNLLFCLFSILYFWILTALTVGIIRVMMIGMPFVFVFSALGLIDIYKKIYSRGGGYRFIL